LVTDIRLLRPEDAAQLEAFLVAHADSSMFLRSNARRGGVVFRGQPFQATYAGAFHRGAIVGVVAHSWSGMVQVQASELVAELTRACVDWSGRQVTGFTGPLHQVREARAALGLETAHAKLCADEGLCALNLSDLIIPSALSTAAIVCRAAAPHQRDVLAGWRLAYELEVLGGTDSAEQRTRAAHLLDRHIADGNAWVALDRGAPVSLSAFNATLPDMVQLGGIYTPPELRGHGFAKVAVAGSLLAARERGASRAVLFTNNPSAVRTYEAVGFARVGDFSLILL
jgi:GNAT superfamily N-acetyltransferase